ncbi:MAG: hypothetical protein RL701_3659 [Pseudomonadota bacterium]
MRCGIEFEYLLIDTQGESTGRIRDFSNLTLPEITRMLGDKPGRDDTRLATGDLGIRSGYWYLEGDERFDEQGQFRTLIVKGVEVRTPPADSVAEAVRSLVELEAALSERLAQHGLGLAINSYHPVHVGYAHDPPLNAWEQRLRRSEPSYDGSLVSTLTYGPDINLSFAGWTAAQCLDAARKLEAYGPYIVPFSFSSPYYAGALWGGVSKRTWERAGQRPVVKLYLDEKQAYLGASSRLVHEARSAHEHGRIEFKAFDVLPSVTLLTACTQLLVGVCLDEQLPERTETADVALYRRAALHGFADPAVYAGAATLLERATAALLRCEGAESASTLEPLVALLAQRSSPAASLIALHAQTGRLYWPYGLADSP